jgi:hypothetical protein
VASFPLRSPVDFARSPLCLPSRATLFRRSFHRLKERWLTLGAGDCLLLATDALARWILAGGDGSLSPAQCFDLVARQKPSSWETFVKECRTCRGLADDDCSAVVLICHHRLSEGAILLGTTQASQAALQAQRREEFEEARRARDRRLMAVLYGDGSAFQGLDLVGPEEIALARSVAEALDELLWQLRPLLDRADAAEQAARLWQSYAPLLAAEPCAAKLRRTLAALGVREVEEVGQASKEALAPQADLPLSAGRQAPDPDRSGQGERTE